MSGQWRQGKVNRFRFLDVVGSSGTRLRIIIAGLLGIMLSQMLVIHLRSRQRHSIVNYVPFDPAVPQLQLRYKAFKGFS